MLVFVGIKKQCNLDPRKGAFLIYSLLEVKLYFH